MPPPFRLAAIDLDGTLLSADHQILPENADAIQELTAQGVVCVLASGRMHESTVRYAAPLGLETPVISYNGAMVRHAVTREVWHHQPVPASLADGVLQFCADNQYHLNYYLRDCLYIAERGPWAEFYLRQTGSPYEVIGDLRRFLGQEPTKLILIDSAETTDRLLPQFQQEYGSALYITKTNPEYLEFMHPSANKGAALALVAERLNIPQAETIAFGDSDNDLPMIQWAGLGVAMEGAKARVREAAGYTAPPYEEAGLAKAIRDIFKQTCGVIRHAECSEVSGQRILPLHFLQSQKDGKELRNRSSRGALYEDN